MRTPCVLHRDAERATVEYTEWSQTNTAIDQIVVAALPPLVELDQLTFDAILDMHKCVIVMPAKCFGIDLTDAEVEQIVEWLIVKE